MYINRTTINKYKHEYVYEHEYKFKDNPETWKLRPEINRPWISTG